MPVLSFITWNPSPEIFSLGPISIRWYGLLFASSFLGGYKIMEYIFKKEKISLEILDKLVIYVAIGTVVGARLGHCFFYDFGYYSKHPLEILQIWKGGLASHGAAIGILVALYFFVKKVSTKSFWWVADRVVITVALAGFFIRMGNLMNSEIIGSVTNVPWAFIFVSEDNLPRHPSQLYEAICYLIIFLILFGLYLKKGLKIKEGFLFGLYLVMVFTTRFCMEFIKEEQVDFEKGMTLNMGQILSIPLILIGLSILIIVQSNKNLPKIGGK